MESTNTSTWANGSRFLLNISNDSLSLTEDTPSVNTGYIAFAIITLCWLGLPGNFLVIAVYVRAMTSSLRVYMFALAVADSAICVCGVILTLMPITVFAKDVSLVVLNIALAFSIFLLVFVAIERLTATIRPHSFNKNPGRACKAVLIIGTAAVVFEALTIVTSVLRLKKSIQVGIPMGMIIVSVLIIIICYTLIAAALLARARSSRKRVSAFSLTASTKPQSSQFRKGRQITAAEDLASQQNPTASTSTEKVDTSRTFQRTERLDSRETSNVTTSVSVVPTNKPPAAQSTAFKNVSLLFVITVVFIACWLPFWLYSMGVPITFELSRIFVVNSVVNPYIYGVASAMFREDVRQFYRQTRMKMSACCH